MKIATKSIVSKEQEDKLFNFRPVFFVAIFLCLGIAFAFCHIAYGVSNWWKILLLSLFIGVAFCRTRRKRIKVLFAVLVLLVSFTCGEAAFSLKKLLIKIYSEKIELNCVIFTIYFFNPF